MMSVGFPALKPDIDSHAGSAVVALRDALEQIDRIKTFLDGKSDSDLTGLGYGSGDVAVLKSAFADLAKLSRIARGLDTQPGASDFFWFARQLTALS